MIDDDLIACEIILRCLARTPRGTICPSEVARSLAAQETEWRALMPEVRRVAAILASEGKVAILQRGVAVDPKTARGPIRLGLCVNASQLRKAVHAVLANKKR